MNLSWFTGQYPDYMDVKARIAKFGKQRKKQLLHAQELNKVPQVRMQSYHKHILNMIHKIIKEYMRSRKADMFLSDCAKCTGCNMPFYSAVKYFSVF